MSTYHELEGCEGGMPRKDVNGSTARTASETLLEWETTLKEGSRIKRAVPVVDLAWAITCCGV